MLEECLSTVTVSSLTGEVKDVLINEVVRFSGEDNSDEVENARENCGGFHGKFLSGLCSVWFPIIRYEVTNFARPHFWGFGISYE